MTISLGNNLVGQHGNGLSQEVNAILHGRAKQSSVPPLWAWQGNALQTFWNVRPRSLRVYLMSLPGLVLIRHYSQAETNAAQDCANHKITSTKITDSIQSPRRHSFSHSAVLWQR